MAEKSVLGTVYETLLCSPGMNEAVKVDIRINRKTVLLLNSVIDVSITKDGEANLELLKLVPKEELEQLRAFGDECLNKAGLKELSEKMKLLISK